MPVCDRSHQEASRTLYAVLDVDSTASFVDVRAAYRRQALLAHPDKGGSKETFQEVVRAFETLSSRRLRAAYDKRLFGKAGPGSCKRKGSGGASQSHCHTAGRDGPSGAVNADRTSREQRQTASESVPSAGVPEASAAKPEACKSSTILSQVAHRSSQTQRRKKTRTLEWALSRLRRSVERLPRELRKQAFDGISGQVRKALLIFIQSQAKDCPTSDSAKVTSKTRTAATDIVTQGGDMICTGSDSETSSSDESSCGSGEITKQALADEDMLDDAAAEDSEDSEISLASFQAPCPGVHQRKCGAAGNAAVGKIPGSNGTKSGCRGVIKNNGKCSKSSYQAIVIFCNIRMVTRCVQNLEAAIELHTILVSIKQVVNDEVQTSGTKMKDAAVLGALVRRGISTVCAETGVTVEEIAPSYRVMIYASALTSGTTIVYGRYSTELDDALQQRERLLIAKESGWPAFRDAWVDIMQLAITPRESAWGSALSRPKTQEEAVAIADEAWTKHAAKRQSKEEQLRRKQERGDAREQRRSKRQENLQSSAEARQLHLLRQVARAALATERALRANARRALAERRAAEALVQLEALRACREQRVRERAERERSDRRWKWLRDPSRTTEELLRGPPE